MRLDDNPFEGTAMNHININNYEVTDKDNDDDDGNHHTKSNNAHHHHNNDRDNNSDDNNNHNDDDDDDDGDDDDGDDDDDPSVKLLLQILQKAVELAGGEDKWDNMEEDERDEFMKQATALGSEGRTE